MVYIFVFLGEFGYELFNWQGVVRKFATTILPNDQIICCSRANLYPIYETAVSYIDISKVEIFQQSRASGYWSLPTQDDTPLDLIKSWFSAHRLKNEIRSFVLEQLKTASKSHLHNSYKFIFSDEKRLINGCQFGRSKPLIRFTLAYIYSKLKQAFPTYIEQINKLKRVLFSAIQPISTDHLQQEGNIYRLLDISNNLFKKIELDTTILNSVEERLGWSLNKPFILCQARQRNTWQKSDDILFRKKLAQLIETLAEEVNVVLLSFKTGRWLDSYSQFEGYANCFHYPCSSFPEQAAFIHFAKHCLFFTEGDLGSHTYVPPFMGKDVTVIAPRSVYQLESTPIEFWNQNVFHFGGQMIAKASEDVFSSDDALNSLVADIRQRLI